MNQKLIPQLTIHGLRKSLDKDYVIGFELVEKKKTINPIKQVTYSLFYHLLDKNSQGNYEAFCVN